MSPFKHFFLPLLFLPAFSTIWTGCEKPAATTAEVSQPRSPTPEEIIDARIQYELAEIRAQSRKGRPDDAVDEEKKFAQTIAEAQKISDVRTRDRRFSEIANQSMLGNRFDEADQAIRKIKDDALRDSLLKDFVRLRMKEINETWQHSDMLSGDKVLSDGLRDWTRQLSETARMIVDPFHRAEALRNITLLQVSLKDQDGAVATIREAADSLRMLPDDDIRKAGELCALARWLIRHDEKDAPAIYCREAGQAAMHLNDAFEAAAVFLDLSSLYTLLGDDEKARMACLAAKTRTQKIADPSQKASMLLRLAETSLVVQMKDKTVSTAQKLNDIKGLVLEADGVRASLKSRTPNPMADERRKLSVFPPLSTEPLENQRILTILGSDEFKTLRGAILLKIAKMQVWGAPLEDVWETVQDIDEGPQRDEAIVAAVEMLIASGAKDDAEAWIEEISDPKTRKKLNPDADEK